MPSIKRRRVTSSRSLGTKFRKWGKSFARQMRRTRFNRALTSANRVYTYVRLGQVGSVAGSGAVYLNSIGVNLSSLINATDYTNLYDEYRFLKVTAMFWLSYDQSAGSFPNANNSAYAPMIYYARDHNDATSPGSIGVVQEYANCKMKRMIGIGRPIKMTFKPNTLGTEGGTSSKTTFTPWLSCADPSIFHYGYKYGIDFLPTGQVLNIQLKYTIQFKNVK